MSSKVDESKDGIILAELKDILSTVKSELSFAEAKHGAFLAFAVVVLFEIVGAYGSEYAPIYKVVYFIFGILWLIPMYKCLSSFSPNTNTFKDEEDGNYNKDKDKDVLIFYGKISQYKSSKLYLNDLYKEYFDYDIDDIPKINLDYAKQILINSQITQKKYDLFKSALTWTKNIFIGFIICMIVVFSAKFISENSGTIKNLYKKNDSISVEVKSVDIDER